MYEYAILGGGVIGCAILNKLTRLGKKCVLIEKGEDVAVGTSKANSGIVHAGFDAKTGSLKARLNVAGARVFEDKCNELNVPFVKNGAIVVGNDLSVVEELYNRGVANGVDNLHIVKKSELKKLLPNINDNITCGLYAKDSAIVSPYKLTIALAEQAVVNGGDVVLGYNAITGKKDGADFVISDGNREIRASKVILAVGGDHNNVANIFGSKQYDIKYRRGEYYLLDKGAIDIGGLTIFPLPTKDSKGVLLTPTVSGNIIVGPTSIPCEDNNTITTAEGLAEISSKASDIINNVNLKKNIRVFSGVRTVVGDDFVIEKDPFVDGLINVTGICSPGLSACFGIAEYLVELMNIDNKEIPMTRLEKQPTIAGKSISQINELIKVDSRFGKIVCRCENISEMEIVNAIQSPLKPKSIDAIKRRTRAGMGRCQGGFCFSKVMEIIARECNMSIDEVLKENQGSRIIVGDIKQWKIMMLL